MSNIQMNNNGKQFQNLAAKPPVQQHAQLQNLGQDSTALNNLTSKTTNVPSKWTVNIQEIVKRTQKNLDRGPSLSKGSTGDRKLSGEAGDMQYLSKHMKNGFGSSSTKDKSSLLYHDLKKKLSYDSGPQGGGDISAGLRRKDNLLGHTTQNKTKTTRPGSVNNLAYNGSSTQIGAKSLYLVNQKSNMSQALNDRLAIARIKRRSNEEAHETYSQDQGLNNNDVSATTGSIQGTQGVGEMYHNKSMQNHYGAMGGSQYNEERALTHQRTLMQAGRLNQIGANEEDEESHFMNINNSSQARVEFRRHNSNINKPSAMILAQQDQMTLDNYDDDSQAAIIEAGLTDEQTQRKNNHDSMQRFTEMNEHSLDEPTVLSNNNFASGGAAFGTKQLRPSNSTGAPMISGSFTETGNSKRQTTDLQSRMQKTTGQALGGANNRLDRNNVEHRQKIFEEEIIKRIKEIQRYVKSLHLQLKKTQAGHEKLKDEVDSDKDVLISLQQSVEMQNKKYQSDKLKQVSMQELEGNLREHENQFNQKLVAVVQEAADQTLKQVNNELIPESRLKMYDSITEETNRLKIDLDYQLQTFKRELNDNTKKDRQKNLDLIEKDVVSLRNEMLAEQSSQTLQILEQVDGQIAKTLKESRSLSLPQADLQNLRFELCDKIQTSEAEISHKLRQEMLGNREDNTQEILEKLSQLEIRSTEQLNSRLNSFSSKFITPEFLSEQLKTTRVEIAKSNSSEIKKSLQSQKQQFISSELFQMELQKIKRDLSKQVKTGLEEAKFDTVQMVQGDIVEVANHQKDARFKVQELAGNIDDVKGSFEEAMLRLTNREKEQATLQQRSSQLQERHSGFENKLEHLNAEIRELKARESRSPVKASPMKEEVAIDSYRSAPNAFALEEIDNIREELKQISDRCNVTQSQVEENEMAVSNNKSSADKQLKAIKAQIDEVNKQVIDVQFESGQNKQFFEDQLSELTQSTEALQERIIENRDFQSKETESIKKECNDLVKQLDESTERQFQNLHQGVALLEEWQAKVKNEAAPSEVPLTAHTDQASHREEQLQSQQEAISDLTDKIQKTEKSMDIMKARMDSVEQDNTEDKDQASSQIGGLQAMLATLSERNNKLEDNFNVCLTQLQTHSSQIETLDEANQRNSDKKNGEEKVNGIEVSVQSLKSQVDQQALTLNKEIDQVSSKAHQQASELNEVIELQKLQIADIESKIESLEKQALQKPPVLSRLSSQANSQSKWQESSIKKLQPKKATTGWAEVRMTKIEPKEQSMRSSQLEHQMVCASGSQSLLKALPPQVDDIEDENSDGELDNPFNNAVFDSAKPQSISNSATKQHLMTPDLSTSMKKSPSQVEIEGLKLESTNQLGQRASNIQEQKPLLSSMSFDHVEKETNEEQDQEKDQQEDLTSANNNFNGMGRPTEYSASVEYQQTSNKRAHELEPSDASELQIKSPVQFEIMNESEVKVNETNSSMANLLIQDRIAFDDDNNLNDQIISPSDGIQVPNASEFYKLQREFRSNQVQKKNEIAIRASLVEQEIESEKVDSPKRLDAASDFIDDEHAVNDEDGDELKLNEEREGKQDTDGESAIQDSDHFNNNNNLGGRQDQEQFEMDGERIGDSESNASSLLHLEQQLLKGIATSNQLRLRGDNTQQSSDRGSGDKNKNDTLKEQGNNLLFRTQKMAGLAQLSQNATHQQLLKEGLLDEADLEMEQQLIKEASNFEDDDDQQSEQLDDDLDNLQSHEDDDNMDGIPTSSAILGMKLGGHDRKNSDSKSSIMGLSALGLESHRESQEQYSDMKLMRELESGRFSVDESNEKHNLQEELDAMQLLDSKLSAFKPEDGDTNGDEQEDMVVQVVSALVSNEIMEALSIMQALNHPRINELSI